MRCTLPGSASRACVFSRSLRNARDGYVALLTQNLDAVLADSLPHLASAHQTLAKLAADELPDDVGTYFTGTEAPAPVVDAIRALIPRIAADRAEAARDVQLLYQSACKNYM